MQGIYNTISICKHVRFLMIQVSIIEKQTELRD